MNIFYILFLSVPTIHLLQIREIMFRHSVGPITTVRNDQLWSRCSHGSYLHVISPSSTIMNGHATLTRTATVEIRRQRNNRRTHFNSIINSSHQNGMAFTHLYAGNGYPV